jgi:DMSO/TMAO reductase YedYZ molybdopterin-dependent catalytic subunit
MKKATIFLITAIILCATGGSFAISEVQHLNVNHEFADASIRVVGKVDNPLTLSLDDLKTMSATTAAVMPHCEHEIGSFGEGPFTYKGVLLKVILDRAGVIGEPQDTIHYAVLVKAMDGYITTIAYGEIRENRDIFGHNHIILAYEKDGKPLGKDEGTFRLIVPLDYYQGRWVKWVCEIEVRDAA